MSRLRAAVIGAGQIGRHHIRIYENIADVDLVAVCDQNPETIRQATRDPDLRTYDDFGVMFEREKPDLVSVAVPTQFHHQVASEAIQRGIHTLVEKPIAITIDEGNDLVRLAHQHNVTLMVGHVERFNPAVREARRRLELGELGQVFELRSVRASPAPDRIRDVGVTLDLATHDIDIMCYLLGCPVDRVYAETQRGQTAHEDLLSGLMHFQNGSLGVLSANWVTPTKIRQLSIVGERGMYLIDYLTQDLWWYQNSFVSGDWPALGVIRSVWEGDVLKVRIAKAEPLDREIRAFVEAVQEGTPSPVGGDDGVNALQLAHALMQSGTQYVPISMGQKRTSSEVAG